MKYIVENDDDRLGEKATEYFDTLEEAKKGLEYFRNAAYEGYKDEVMEKALDKLDKQIQEAIYIKEI